MYNLAEMSKAENRVYIVANADGTDAEFIPMDALEAGFQDLAARRPGMQGRLAGVGLAGLVGGVPVVQLRQDPDDFMVIVRLTAAFSQYVVAGREVHNAEFETPPHVGDSVVWCDALYALPDTRFEL
ncbi:MAG TPA: hypothetical protein VK814_01675 [Acidobacteriaceae bacterium]|jgi:hypothetical protein|nr:hypothetical protein [Acidobacteriaceae bacterium]